MLTLPGGTNLVAIEDVVAAVVCEAVGRRAPAVVLPTWSLPAVATVLAAARAVLGDRVSIAPSQVRMSGAAIYANGQKALRGCELPQTPFKSAVEHAYEWYRENGYIRQPKG
jgi:hypothetical protein